MPPTDARDANLWRGRPESNFLVAFLVREPAAGPYVLQFVDGHTSERETPDMVKDVPLRE